MTDIRCDGLPGTSHSACEDLASFTVNCSECALAPALLCATAAMVIAAPSVHARCPSCGRDLRDRIQPIASP